MLNNPFERQAQFHKKEAQKWRSINIVVGVIFVIVFFLLFGTC